MVKKKLDLLKIIKSKRSRQKKREKNRRKIEEKKEKQAGAELWGYLLLARAAALQSVVVRRSTGNDVVATISTVIFFSFFPFLRRDLFP